MAVKKQGSRQGQRTTRPDTSRRKKRQSRQEREEEVRKRLLFGVGGAVVLLLLILAIFGLSSRLNRRSTTGSGTVQEAASEAALPQEETELLEMIPIEEADLTLAQRYPDKPDIDINDWKYILANSDHSVADYEPVIDYLEGVPLDYRVVEPMSAFVEGARAQGLNVVIASGYRSYEEQTWTFDLQLEMMDEEEAAKVVARPGTSEHQTGLAADITDDYYEIKTEQLEQTALYQWMSQHCQDYGFIVRFPKDKEEITKIIYEPWHFRYVGEEAAKYMADKGLCLEEFVALYEQ